jgi:hypothetical protein
MAAVTDHRVLSDDILARCAERAPVYDREGRFFEEDFEELCQAGYLRMNVPKALGGMGPSLAQVCQEQRRLAYHAAPTALAVNMHLYWTGVAADLWRIGDKSLEWLLKAAVAGEVVAAGHAESGNDLPPRRSGASAAAVAIPRHSPLPLPRTAQHLHQRQPARCHAMRSSISSSVIFHLNCPTKSWPIAAAWRASASWSPSCLWTSPIIPPLVGNGAKRPSLR